MLGFGQGGIPENQRKTLGVRREACIGLGHNGKGKHYHQWINNGIMAIITHSNYFPIPAHIIHHNQLQIIEQMTSKWCQKGSSLQIVQPFTEKTWEQGWRLYYFWWAKKQREKWRNAFKVAPYSFWTARELISKISRWRELSISTLKSRAESRSKMPTNMASKFLKFVYR